MRETQDVTIVEHACALARRRLTFRRRSWQKMMMWWFIVTDGLLFAGFLASYGFVRAASGSWPKQAEVFHMNFITAMTFILITSSATMASRSFRGTRRESPVDVAIPVLTIAGGLTFLGMQAFEWTTLIREGANAARQPVRGPQASRPTSS